VVAVVWVIQTHQLVELMVDQVVVELLMKQEV
jgi:hypothetical protein